MHFSRSNNGTEASNNAVESDWEGPYRPQPEATHCLFASSSSGSGKHIVRTTLDKGAGLANFISAKRKLNILNFSNFNTNYRSYLGSYQANDTILGLKSFIYQYRVSNCWISHVGSLVQQVVLPSLVHRSLIPIPQPPPSTAHQSVNWKARCK